jgi:hypothetical protein
VTERTEALTTEFAFNLAFPLAVPFWVLMIVLPGWRWTRRVVGSPLIVLVPLVAYLFAVFPILPEFAAGRWMYLDSWERGVPALVMASVLVLTILLSPFGLMAYLALRTAWRRRSPEAA